MGKRSKEKKLGMSYSLNSPSSSVQKSGDTCPITSQQRGEQEALLSAGQVAGHRDNGAYLLPGGLACGPERWPSTVGHCWFPHLVCLQNRCYGFPSGELWLRVQRRGSGCGGAGLTGDVQVGIGLDLPSFITGKALEDPRVLRTQLLDPQAST